MIKQMKSKVIRMCHVCKRNILPGCDYIQEKCYDGHLHYVLNRHIHCDAVLYGMDTCFQSRDVENVITNICDSNCDKDGPCDIYSCDTVHKMLLNPVMYNAARRSVEENGGANGE